MVRLEEERFGNTVTVGLSKLGELDLEAISADENALFTSIAKLYDTFGSWSAQLNRDELLNFLAFYSADYDAMVKGAADRRARFCDALASGVAERLAGAPEEMQIPMAQVVLHKRPRPPR